jgi:GT2 family glycosyltransferase
LLLKMSDAGCPDLSVIVVTHNRPQLAIAALRSAAAASAGLRVQWTVIDSGSTDGTPEAIEAALPALQVRRERNVGFAAANNLGLQDARGRYLLLMNPDVEIQTGTLAQLLHQLDARPQVGLASVIQRAGDGRLQSSLRRFPSPLRCLSEALGAARWAPGSRLHEEVAPGERYEREGPADWLVGAFLLVRAQALVQVGRLDERFFLYSEETDWCYRFHRAGWRVWHLPGASVTHHTPGSTTPELLAQRSFSKVLFARKHQGAPAALAVRTSLTLGHAMRAALAGCAGRFDAGSAARAAAERHALAVMLGIAPPPFTRSPRPRGARRLRRAPARIAARSARLREHAQCQQAADADRRHAQDAR